MNRRRFLTSVAGFGAALCLPGGVSRKLFAAALPADIIDFSAIELSEAIRGKDTSCLEVMQAYLQHIHRHNPVYNAIVGMADDDDLLRQARDADEALARGAYRGWMHGMPHAVKDLVPVAGLRYTSGSPMFADRVADTDSPLAARLRGEGAIFIGKTNTPEFGLGSQSYNPVYGATGSAWNPSLTAGGSSGGAASGLGTHMLPVADGSDMMGSLRNPGAFNNVIGYRPSTDVMSTGNGSTRGLSTSGPMGRNTADTIRLLQSIAVKQVGSQFSPRNLSNTKIGWLGNLDQYLAMEDGILDLCTASLRTVTDAGATVESTQPRFRMEDLWFCWTTLRHSGRTGMRRYYDDPQDRRGARPSRQGRAHADGRSMTPEIDRPGRRWPSSSKEGPPENWRVVGVPRHREGCGITGKPSTWMASPTRRPRSNRGGPGRDVVDVRVAAAAHRGAAPLALFRRHARQFPVPAFPPAPPSAAA